MSGLPNSTFNDKIRILQGDVYPLRDSHRLVRDEKTFTLGTKKRNAIIIFFTNTIMAAAT